MSDTLTGIRDAVTPPGDRAERARRFADLIRRARGYRWVGVYDVDAANVSVLAWSGPAPPAHPRFPVDQGLNGAAIASCEPVIVQDVRRDPRYLTTLGTTAAEAIFPVLLGENVVGTIDVESDAPNTFTEDDVTFLAACAKVVLPLFSTA